MKRGERGRTYEEAMADTLFGRMAALNQAGRDFGNVFLASWLGRAIVAATEHLDRWLTRGHYPDG